MKHCFVIPVYNHPHYLAALLSHLSAFELPIIMVNDGSDADLYGGITSARAGLPKGRFG